MSLKMFISNNHWVNSFFASSALCLHSAAGQSLILEPMTSRSTAGLDGVVPIEFMPVSMKEGRVPAGRWDGGRIHYRLISLIYNLTVRCLLAKV